MNDTAFDIPGDLHTPVSAFLKLRPLGARYLLESVEAGAAGRYSFIGFGEAQSIEVDNGQVMVDGNQVGNGVLDGLRAALDIAPECLTASGSRAAFSGGLVGCTSFDFVRDLYPIAPSRHLAGVPAGSYVATESVLAFDHLTRRMAVLHSGTSAEARRLRSEVQSALRGPIDHGAQTGASGPPAASMTKDEFIDRVGATRDHITAGDVYQLVLSVRFEGTTDVDPFLAYRALRLTNPSPYMYFIDLDDRQVVGSSPEALAKLTDGVAELRPIAGTRPRGSDDGEDLRLERDLMADPKEAAEHVMLVDLARNDVGRTAEVGSVVVDPFKTIERYSHVMHMVSGVRARLRGGLDEFDLFAATFPAGTVSGAPKLRALELIDELEPVSRGFYSGSVGYFGHTGAMDQAITIRTLVFEEDRYVYQAGAGLVADSRPQFEYEEVLAKAAAMRSALELAKEGL